jgi:hypothetical protein
MPGPEYSTADLPGLQYMNHFGVAGSFAFDHDGNLLTQEEPIHSGSPLPVNWR